MVNQPTLKEFLSSKHDDIIMSQNGSFFLIKSNNSKLYKALKMLLKLIFIFIIPLLIKLDDAWPNITVDILLLWPLLLRALAKLEYANCHFEYIDDDTEDHEEAIDWLRSHAYRNRVRFKILIGLVVLFAIVNSFTAFYIRSHVENRATISDMSITLYAGDSDNYLDFPNCENFSEIVIPNTTIECIYINAKMSGKLEAYQFKLNDRNLLDIHCKKGISVIWDQEIFPQYYSGYLLLNGLPDNSVLEISSGSFSRQWTIKTE